MTMEKNNIIQITLGDLPALSSDAFRITEEELYIFFTLGAANGFLKDESGKIDVSQSAPFLRQVFEQILDERLVYGDGGILKCSKKREEEG